MSNLVDHARYELDLAGLGDDDADYGGALATAVMELIQMFADQGHSGASAAITIDLFAKLARFEPLTPITADAAEWADVSDISGTPLWQNRRRSTSFSRDGGVTWYDIEDESRNNGDVMRRDAA